MTILTWPAIVAPSKMSLYLRSNNVSHTSPFTGSTQTIVRPGSRFQADLTWETLSDEDRRTMAAFLARLNGQAGRFTWGPPAYDRRGAATGTPLVNGATQTGTTLNVDGWTSGGVAMQTGDLLSFVGANGRSELHMVVADATPSGGATALTIAPQIRSSPADNAAVEIVAPVGVWKLLDDEQGQLETRAGWFGALSLQIEEAIF